MYRQEKISFRILAQNRHFSMIFITLIFFCMSFIPELVVAQDTVYSGKVTIVAPIKPVIQDANKINTSPKIIESEIEKESFDYSISSSPIHLSHEPNQLKPVSIVGEPLTKLYRNLIKAGFGNYKTPYFEFFASSLRSKEKAFGVHLQHLSSGDLKSYPNSSQSHNLAEVYGKKFTKNHTLQAQLFFDRKVFHYYGIEQPTVDGYDISEDKLKQRYISLGINTSLQSNYLKSKKLEHGINLDYQYFYDRFQSSEHKASLSIPLKKQFELISIFDKEIFGLNTEVVYFNNSDSLSAYNHAVVKLQPFVKASFNEYYFKIGFNAGFGIDSTSKFYIKPVIEAGLNIIPDNLNLKVGIDGDIIPNSFSIFADQNPYITSILPYRITENRIRFYGNLTGRANKKLDFTIGVSGSSFNDLPLFVNDTSTQRNKDLNNQFTVIYDDVKEIHGNAEIIFHESEKFDLGIEANFYQYNPENEKEAWHKPQYDITFKAKYNLQQKFIFDCAFIFYGKSYAKTYDESFEIIPEELSGFIDINLGIEYRYSKKLGAFVQLNNIANKEYFLWNNYASKKLNFLAGLSYAF